MTGSGSPLALHLKQNKVNNLESVYEAVDYFGTVSDLSQHKSDRAH